MLVGKWLLLFLRLGVLALQGDNEHLLLSAGRDRAIKIWDMSDRWSLMKT